MPHKTIDAKFRDLVDEFAPVDRIATGCVFTEGPIWHPVDRNLLFSDMPGDVRRRWTPADGAGGRVEEVQRPSNKGNGMTYDRALNLIVCEHSTSSVVRIAPSGERTTLCTHFEGRELNSPNDVVVKSDGSIWFTDPTYGRMEHFGVPRPTVMGFQGVYRLPPDHRPGGEPQLVSDRYMFGQPNGLTFSPCERWMWVNDTDQANIRMFDVATATDGGDRLTNGRVFASGIRESARAGLPDGMKADREGNVYVTAPGGVWVYDFHGLKLGEIEAPEMVANLAWGGEDWRTLFLCATTSVYTVRTKALPRLEPYMNAANPPDALMRPASESAAGPAAALKRLDPKRTALIIQDMQNDVMMDGGAFASTGSPDHARAQNVVVNSRRLAAACRAKGVMVLHVWMICEPGHPHLAQHAALMQGLKSENALVRGTWGAAPAPGLEPQPGDLVVEKMSMSAWETSRLESYLNHAGIEAIISTGAWTNMSVEHTARTGADKGFRVVVPEDACSTMNADWHRASIAYAMSNVADVTDVDAVIAALG